MQSFGNPEYAFDETRLTNDIGLRQPADLSLADDAHALVARIVFNAPSTDRNDWPVSKTDARDEFGLKLTVAERRHLIAFLRTL
jgi:hypothetical protein